MKLGSTAEIEEGTGKRHDTIHVVGGGCQDKFLNRMLAEETGKEVYAGPIEATAIGNRLAQMLRTKTFDDLMEARKVVAKSFDVPACADYTAEGFVSRPVIEAKIDGRDCAVVRYSDKTVFLTPSGDTYEKELHGTLFGLCGKYSDFVAGAFKFSELKPYLWRGTNLYKTLSEFDNRWYYNYDHIGNEGEKFTDFKVYSEDLVSFHAEYTQVLYDANNKVRFRIKIKLDVYAGRDKETGTWYLLDIQ